MGGSGGGGAFVGRSPEELRDLVRKAEDKSTGASFDAELGEILGKLLGAFNGRNHELVRSRLEDVKSALKNEIDGAFDQMFGGSVAKHTFVDGLSDIDSLVILDNTTLEAKSPQKALAHMTRVIAKQLGSEAKVEHGRMAVTVTYPDGMEIQLLPALKGKGSKVHVPSSRIDGWSQIDPVGFQEALTKYNKQCGGKLVPVIKLAKAINGQLPKAQQLSGYHMESLGIAAFKGYTGEKTSAAMLPVFFERARELVLKPIRDSTGQSVHVDAYLGDANSQARQAASHVLGRIARRMRNSTNAASDAQWRALFGLEP
jgi:hypothetical protein